MTVRADQDDDGTNDSAVLSHAIDGATEYASLGDPTVTVTVTDDEATENQPPPAPAVRDQRATVGFAFGYQFDAVTDPEADDVSYSAALTDGSALSTVWLTFDPATRTFGGTPAAGDVGALSVRVTATDDGTPNRAASSGLQGDGRRVGAGQLHGPGAWQRGHPGPLLVERAGRGRRGELRDRARNRLRLLQRHDGDGHGRRKRGPAPSRRDRSDQRHEVLRTDPGQGQQRRRRLLVAYRLGHARHSREPAPAG